MTDIISLSADSPIVIAGQAANQAAAPATFTDCRTRKAPNTIRRQDADLQLFADYLKAWGVSTFVGLPKDFTTERTEITEKTS